MVSLIAFIMTGYGLNPYLVATFNSGLACEYAKSQIMAAALEQTNAGMSSYSMAPRSLKCISTPGLVSGGGRPPETAVVPKIVGAPAPPAKKPPVRK
ncbi:MAG TPA: hypothetical protein VGP22_09065 [Albitalea sp.]|nr:hypothetical protein [Albitalea sp.]